MRRRVVIVSHPDFQEDGASGVKAAMDMIKQFKEGNETVIKEVKKRGIQPNEFERFERWISQLEYFVRQVEL